MLNYWTNLPKWHSHKTTPLQNKDQHQNLQTDMEQSTCKNYDLINILLHEKEQHTFYNLLKASKRIFPVLIISFQQSYMIMSIHNT